jgi:MoaA/NifB/PqqE/SkfB family radical SAM enzyme
MTNFWKTREVRQLHIELTNACNAACPMCVRFYRNSPLPRPDLTIGEITLEKFKEYFPPDLLSGLVKILFCGTQGDPCMASNTLEICEYILEHTRYQKTAWWKPKKESKFVLQMNTNGGMRNPEWWAKLGAVFANRNTKDLTCWRVIFSIDGLEDTNHLYRRNVKWKNLMANAKAFIDAGGNAVWEYLIFEHNEHQIEEARKMADDLGFVLFVPKRALGVDNGKNLTTMNVLNKEGQLEYVIKAPKNPENRNLKTLDDTVINRPWSPFTIEDYRELKKTKSNDNYSDKVNKVYEIINHEDTKKFDSCEIKCKANIFNDDKEVFVDNFGRVHPCCYIGTHMSGVFTDYQSLQLHKHMTDYGWDNFDLNKHSLKEILDAGHLDRVYADSWTKPSVKEGKMAYCSNICGQVSNIDRVYFQSTKELILKQKSIPATTTK